MASMRINSIRQDSTDYWVMSYPIRRPACFGLLTSAELEVVEAVLEGLSQAVIAKRRGVKSRTVVNQIASAYRKLGVGSRGGLVSLVVARGG